MNNDDDGVGGYEYGDEYENAEDDVLDEFMIVTHHKVANDYSGKEKRHADF